MVLEDYFDFEKIESKFGPTERIRLRGNRINLEHVIGHYKDGTAPEYIASNVFPTLTLDQVYATILYYLRNQEAMDRYLAEVNRIADAYYREYLEKGSYWLRDEFVAERQARLAGSASVAHE